MDLFDIHVLKEVMSTVDLDQGKYVDNDNINHIRELLNILFTFQEIGRFYTLTMRRHKLGSKASLDALYDVLEATNSLAYEYYQHNNKLYKYGKVMYSRNNVEKLKI